MRALTIWQPWASLIMAGAKNYEFRGWDYRDRYKRIEGKQIVIHAGRRLPRADEICDIMKRLDDERSALDPDIARPALQRILEDLGKPPRKRSHTMILGFGLGTAFLGKPIRTIDLFGEAVNDSDRIDHSKWAWPLEHVTPFDEPVPRRGAQGFWIWRKEV